MDILIIVTLLVIAAETTYLAAKSGKLFTHQRSGRPVFIDTSVLIDGRIIPVVQSGFVTSTLMIPRSVVGELQLLADQGDHEKRSRARHGLDVVNELQQIPGIRVEIFNDGTSAPKEGVDNRLLKLAKRYNGSICTIDYNLNKVAVVENIPVLNVNDLAMNLRMAYLPGERIMLDLVQKGHDSHQAIGHLTDGTMVVVEQASSRLGQTAEIEFIRSLQTAAGKMMFAKLVKPAQPAVQPKGTKQKDAAVVVATDADQKQQKQPKRPSRTQRKAQDAPVAAVPAATTPAPAPAVAHTTPAATSVTPAAPTSAPATTWHSEQQKQPPRKQQQPQQRRQQPQQPRPQQQNGADAPQQPRRQQPARRSTSKSREASLIELANQVGE